MNAARVACSVITCDREMPAGQVMCVHCWAKVPKDLRKRIDGAKFATGSNTDLHRQAIAAAQAVPS